jgi:hypothetical protein
MRYTEHHVLYVDRILQDARSGALALPKFQRPYVWDDKDVCDLLDSMLRGIPIGTLLLWGGWSRGASIPIDRVRGFQCCATNPTGATLNGNPTLVLDGQQRLTALLLAASEDSKYVWDANTMEFRVGSAKPLDGIFPTYMMFGGYSIFGDTLTELYEASDGVAVTEERSKTVKSKSGKTTKTYTETVVVNRIRNADEQRIHGYIEAFCKAKDRISGTSVGATVIPGEADVAFARETFRRLNCSGKPFHEAEVFKALEGDSETADS